VRTDHRCTCQVIVGLAVRRCDRRAWDGSGGGCEGACAPADACLAADAGAFLALSGEDVGVAGVGVAPAQVAVEGPGLHGVVGDGWSWPG
jgi:hypothetical protein